MARFALTLEYDGGPFMGLQRQDHGPTVQQAVEEAVQAVTGETVTMNSAGRTDSGVHALAMRSHVDIAQRGWMAHRDAELLGSEAMSTSPRPSSRSA